MAALILGFIVVQRLIELFWAHLNTARLLRLGGKEHAQSHYTLIVGLHASWIAIMLWRALVQNPTIQPPFVFIFLILTAARIWILVTLGRYFTTRIISLPNAPLVRHGPYRFFKHPNYVVVVGEIFCVPLIFGWWDVALIWGVANLALLKFRIQQEDLALQCRSELGAKN